METAPLKSFATAARTELIREVGARITAVLAQGSPERVEQPKAVTALERAIAGAGGGDKGKAHVADKVAYTWFNRVVALRFMDANGYTAIGVVSPATDQVGQPEVLAAAKRGQLDTDVVKGTSATTVTGLLNGTRQPRPGVGAQAEAYALLLADYCRFWNTAMPFMFEREGDYTELLIPANLLAEDSVLSRSVSVLTEDVCQDVEVIGWLYQFYISERKDEVFAGFKKNKKAGADEIPAATQLFTPHWIVRYLVENSLGRLWMLNRPSSDLASQMDFYIAPVDEETDFLKISRPEELKVIDPACGSGHMLTYAFDLLYAIYEEEGYAPSEIPSLILSNNLYGTEIDPRAGALAAFALTMKAVARRKLFLKNPVDPNVCVLEPISFSSDELSYLVTRDGDRYAEESFWNQFAGADTFGSLIGPDPALLARLARHLETIEDDGDMYKADALDWAWQAIRQAEFLAPRYSVVVANPPYLGMRKMTPGLSEFINRTLAFGQQDLYSAFIERAVGLVVPKGLVAMITMQSWMFLSTFESLRRWILESNAPRVVAHLGAGAFDTIGGDVVTTAAFVLSRNSSPSSTATYIDATSGADEASKALQVQAVRGGSSVAYRKSAEALLGLPGSVLGYWASDSLTEAYGLWPALAQEADPRQGLSTANDGRFLRQWYEISRGRSSLGAPADPEVRRAARWIPCNKGGTYRRWYGNQDYVIDWALDGKVLRDPTTGAAIRNPNYYFRQSVSWSNIGGNAAFRYFPEGFIFNAKGMSLFPRNEDDLRGLLGYLNSSAAREALRLVAPINSIEVGHVAVVPVPDALKELDLVDEAIGLAKADWDEYELSWEFERSPLLRTGEVRIRDAVVRLRDDHTVAAARLRAIEEQNNAVAARLLGTSEAPVPVDIADVSLAGNEAFRYSSIERGPKRDRQATLDIVAELVSYAVGCMFGRYSIDEPGLILADQGATVQDYLAKVPSPTFAPDADNVIPVVDGDWFEDDVVGFFRQFLRAAFGEQHFEENLKFVTESLGVRNLRDYFITRAGKSKFYDDHVQRYKKRPIYWLFSSPKGSFNALVYMHRFTPSTVSAVLTYLREYVTKLESSLQQAERAGNAKEADRLRKILVELNEYEHDTLYPKASENVVIDLDDGVKVNYPKFGAALRKIAGLEASGD